MGSDWLAAFPQTCKPFLEETDSILRIPLSKIIAEGPNSTLNSTENSQPAIMAISIMILRVLEKDFGFRTTEKVDVTLGHSLGEFAALVAAGILDYTESLQIIRRRAEAMKQCTQDAVAAENGAEFGMIALIVEPEHLSGLISTIEEFLGYTPFPSAGSDIDEPSHMPAIEQVLIANINSKNQIVLSGNINRIQALLVQLRQFGGHDPRAVRLNSDSPFHSPIMMPAKAVMARLMAKANLKFPGTADCIMNVTGRPAESADDIREQLTRQCVETVRWWDSIKYTDQELGVRRWVGVGPGKVGRNLVGKEVGMKGKDTVKGGGVWGITNPYEVDEFLKALEESDKLE
jgi:[acyl-carrier-protein] S-malonyltransferase